MSLRLCISKKLQDRQVLLALAPQSESQGIRKPAGDGDNLGVKGAIFKKILHKKRKKCRKLIFLYVIAWSTKHLYKCSIQVIAVRKKKATINLP